MTRDTFRKGTPWSGSLPRGLRRQTQGPLVTLGKTTGGFIFGGAMDVTMSSAWGGSSGCDGDKNPVTPAASDDAFLFCLDFDLMD